MDIGLKELNHLAVMMEYYRDRWLTEAYLSTAVPIEIARATCPDEDRIVRLSRGRALVGSAEQAFINAEIEGWIKPGYFYALTPCYRNEPRYDDLHRPEFMKIELYKSFDQTESSLQDMIQMALGGFENVILNSDLVQSALGRKNFHLVDDLKGCLRVVDIGDGSYDIELGGIEIGSYGIREFTPQRPFDYDGTLRWVYGTGLAEPRFSYAIQQCLKAI